MSWVPYRQGVTPVPHPSTYVRVTGVGGLVSARVRAVLDTGATVTVIPTAILRSVGAYQLTGRTARCRGYDGATALLPLFEVDLAVDDPRWPDDLRVRFERLLVLGVTAPSQPDGDSAGASSRASGSAPEVLIGLDVLAAWRLHLDGPQSRYSVE